MRAIPDIAVDFVAKWEALRLKAYKDSAGIWTIGYGHIAGVKQGDTCTPTQAKAWLRAEMEDARAKLYAKIGPIVDELTEHQYAALLSFVYNLGTGRSPWTIWKRLQRREFDQVPGEMVQFVKADVPGKGKVTVQGLVNRRNAEIALWHTPEPGAAVIKLTSAETRNMPTPPVPADPTPPSKSATVWLAVTAAVGGFMKWLTDLLLQVPEFAHTALSAINPFTDKSPAAAMIANGVGGLAAAAGLFVAWSVIRKKKEDRS